MQGSPGGCRRLQRLGLASLLALMPVPLAGQGGGVPDTPRQRWEHFYQQRAYPFSQIPAGALQRAREGLEMAQTGASLAPPPLQGTSWAPFGPERIPIAKTSTGRLTAIAIHPADSRILYVGGAQGGVWKSTNGGESWVPLTDDQCSLAMGSIAIDPVNPEIVYAGTGEQHFSGDSYYGCGVLRSEDGGATWTRLGAFVFTKPEAANARIARIDLDPRTVGSVATTTVLAASDFGLFKSTDGGVGWTRVLDGIATDLVRDPSNPDVMYTALRRSGVFKSLDGGTTWTQTSNGFPTEHIGRINLALAATAPATVLASIQHREDNNLLGIWRTTDGGALWEEIPASGASCGSQCWYNMTMAFHPSDPNIVFFGGVRLYKSVNGGTTFADISGGIHVDQHHLAFDPANPETVFVGNDGGIYRSDDGGANWVSLNTNLALTQFYAGISLHPWDAAVALGGTQDNGTVLSSGTFDFEHVLGGDGGFTAIDFVSPNTRYAETQWVSDQNYIGPRRSDGGSFELRTSGINISDRALFIPPLVMDPLNSARLYFGTVRLYRTENGAERWRAISPEFPGRISAIAPAASDPGVVYVGTSNASVHLTTDGGDNWTDISAGLPNRFIKDVAVDPADWQRAVLSVSGFGTGHVFRTTDGGATWEDISSDLPDMPVNAVLLDPVEPNTIFIGTDLGVFVSTDGGGTWSAISDGLPNVAVFDLAYNASTGVLLAGTHGRGMFSLNLDRALTLAVVPGNGSAGTLYGSEVPLADSATVLLTGTDASTTTWTATHGSGSWLSIFTAEGTGTGRLHWTRDPTGLEKGTFVDTIRVSVPGAVDSPFELVDTLVVDAPLTMSLETTGGSHTAIVGSTIPVNDSALVTLTGLNASQAPWQAVHGGGSWLTITTPTRVGTRPVLWTRDPTGLEAGIYVDTITVLALGALGAPASIVDTLAMVALPLGLDPDVRESSGTAGALTGLPDSARVLMSGEGAEGAQWNATVPEGSWVVLTGAAGTGPGMLRWERNLTGLGLGTHVDTIRVTSTNEGFAQLVDRITLSAPFVLRGCAANHLMGASCLSDLQLRFLDMEGNGDGRYNLGDFLAQMAREKAGGSPEDER